jgi:hypothetical protein
MKWTSLFITFAHKCAQNIEFFVACRRKKIQFKNSWKTIHKDISCKTCPMTTLVVIQETVDSYVTCERKTTMLLLNCYESNMSWFPYGFSNQNYNMNYFCDVSRCGFCWPCGLERYFKASCLFGTGLRVGYVSNICQDISISLYRSLLMETAQCQVCSKFTLPAARTFWLIFVVVLSLFVSLPRWYIQTDDSPPPPTLVSTRHNRHLLILFDNICVQFTNYHGVTQESVEAACPNVTDMTGNCNSALRNRKMLCGCTQNWIVLEV